MLNKEFLSNSVEAFKVAVAAIYGEGSSMFKYMLKEHTPYAMPEGFIWCCDIPTIKKDFCFGYRTDYSGHECSDAERTRSAAARSTEFFMNENLRGLRDTLNILKGSDKLFWRHQYNNTCPMCDYVTEEYIRRFPFDIEGIDREMSAEERDILVKAVENEIEKFTKRLNTYLKRYGLSKLHTWTFWLDE